MKREKIFWGIFFILAAAFMIISQLGFLQGVGTFRIVWAVFFVAVMLKGMIRLNFGEILFPLAFICILFDKQLGITAITPWTVLGAALFGTIGLSMLFRRKNHYWCGHYWKQQEVGYANVNVVNEEGFERVENRSDGNHVNYRASFGSAMKYVNADDFQYAELECSFGAMKVYFDNAVIRNGTAVINLDVSFGALEIFIPKSWEIVNHVDVSFSGIEEKNHSQSTGSPVVTLTGSASFSGLTIIYV